RLVSFTTRDRSHSMIRSARPVRSVFAFAGITRRPDGELPDGWAVYHGNGSALAYSGPARKLSLLRTESRVSRGCLSFLGTGKRELQQALDQLGETDPGGLPQSWIHADRGETRHRVYLVQQDLACVDIEEEIDARQPGKI